MPIPNISLNLRKVTGSNSVQKAYLRCAFPLCGQLALEGSTIWGQPPKVDILEGDHQKAHSCFLGILDEKCLITIVARCSPATRALIYMGQCLMHRPVPGFVCALASHVSQGSKTTRDYSSFVRSSELVSQTHGIPICSTTICRTKRTKSRTNGLPYRSTTICGTKHTILERQIETAVQHWLRGVP